MRNTVPTSASASRSYSARSVSHSTTPSPEPGSYDLITPCTRAPRQGTGVSRLSVALLRHESLALRAPCFRAVRRPPVAALPAAASPDYGTTSAKPPLGAQRQ